MNKIINVLRQIGSLPDKEAEKLIDITSQKTIKKGEFWIEAGKINRYIGFIDSGYLRKYYIKDGRDITDYFYFENDFTADLPSMLNNNTPHSSIAAMKDSVLTVFLYDEFNRLCLSSPALEHLHRLIVEMTFIRFYNRTISFITDTPAERYGELISTRPDILQRAALHHIASYLGISPQHLSRIRSGKIKTA